MKNKKISEHEKMKGGGDYDIYTGTNGTIKLYTQAGFEELEEIIYMK